MIKITLNDILNSTEIFGSIMQQSFKGSVAFKIARLIRELNKEMDTFNIEREKILHKYCEVDKNGQLIFDEEKGLKVKDGKANELNEEFSALLATEVEINADKLPDEVMDSFDISPQEMLNLEKFFEN